MAAVLVAVGVGWILVTALLVRAQLNTVRDEVHAAQDRISAGQPGEAAAAAVRIVTHTRRARALTAGPAWAVAARIPLLGTPFRTIRGITSATHDLGEHAMPELVAAGSGLDPAHLRTTDGAINLLPITNAAAPLQAAGTAVDRVTTTVLALPAHSWLRPVNGARATLLGQLQKLTSQLQSAQLAIRIAPNMLGATAPKTYFIAFQNDAEARGTGGLPGAFAVVTARNGVLSFDKFGSDRELDGVSAGIDLGPEYDTIYGNGATTTKFINGNLSPHFPYAAQIWASMWERHSGQHIDGVIAVDPTALSYLLAAAGPAHLPDGTAISADNVVTLTQSTAYTRFPANQPAARQAYLIDIAKAIATRLTTSHADPRGFFGALRNGADQRRLLVWSADPSVEADLARTPMAGMVPETRDPYAGLSIVNDGGNKLDYYLDRSLTWTRVSCAAPGDITVAVTLTNNAPAGLNTYVTARSDKRDYQIRPGDNRLLVGYGATSGAVMRSVTVDGKPVAAALGAERGHPVFTVDLELPRGATRTVVLHLHEPASTKAPIVLRQPLVRPLAVSVVGGSCPAAR
jgi:hypothetical protein